ncbi:pyocin activator PrtN family protein [Pseudomonas poae]|nr:pyocin activator PrtN family protein [Pseudomonas poae]
MNTLFLLMAQYNGQAVIPLETVCRDYLNLSYEQAKRKQLAGELDLPIIRLGGRSQKSALGIHLSDLANYIDKQRDAAVKELDQLMGRYKRNS